MALEKITREIYALNGEWDACPAKNILEKLKPYVMPVRTRYTHPDNRAVTPRSSGTYDIPCIPARLIVTTIIPYEGPNYIGVRVEMYYSGLDSRDLDEIRKIFNEEGLEKITE